MHTYFIKMFKHLPKWIKRSHKYKLFFKNPSKMKQPLLVFQLSLIRKHKSVSMFTNSLHPGTVVVHRLLFVCWEGSVHCVSPSASHTSHRFSSTAKCPWQVPLSQRQGTSCFHWVSVEYFQVNSVPAFTTLREKKHTPLSTNPEQQTQPSSSSSSSPVCEEGNDREGWVVGVCEDVLEEQVWVAAML